MRSKARRRYAGTQERQLRRHEIQSDATCLRQAARESMTGFTLIELLVVIAIIGVLASLILTSLTQAKVTAEGAVCRSNLSQLGIAFRMYLDEVHGYPLFPPFSLQPYVNAKAPGSDQGTYKPDHSVWICPAYRRLGLVDDMSDGSLGSFSYGYNVAGYSSQQGGYMGGLANGAGSGPNRSVTDRDVLVPNDLIQYGDSVLGLALGLAPRNDLAYYTSVYHGGSYSLDSGVTDSLDNYSILIGLTVPPPAKPSAASGMSSGNPFQQYDPIVTQAYRRRHAGRWNLLFCDGHVENLRPQDAFDTRQPEQMRRWNRDHAPHNQ